MKDDIIGILELKTHIWCLNKDRWETDNLTKLPSGDFISDNNHIHSKQNHIEYVQLQDVADAISSSKATLKQRYDSIIKEYAEAFLRKHNFQEDEEDGELYDYEIDEKGWLWVGDYTFNMDDVRLDIDENAPKGLFIEWYDSNISLNCNINYYSWIMNSRPPRIAELSQHSLQ